MAAVLGRTLQKGMACDCGGTGQQDDEEIYWDTPRRGLLHSSFAMFYIVVIVLNSVAILAGILSQIDFHSNNNNNKNNNPFHYMDGWYMCNAIFGVLHILSAFYLVRKIEEPTYFPNSQLQQRQQQEQQQRHFVAAEMIGAADYQPAPRDPPYNPAIYSFNYSKNNRQPTVHTYAQATMIATPATNTTHAPATTTTATGIGGLPYHPSATTTAVHHHPVINYEPRVSTEPETWARVRQVLCQSPVFAVYILVFGVYVIWHKFFDVRTYNQAMLFVMKSADIFIIAGPSAFALCVVMSLMKRREL
ncbi:hypothetical protein ACA910_005588 [Epithemia clementina (nom. ined.)]